MKRLKLYSLCLLMMGVFTTCKKYPENTLWFKNVKKLEFLNSVRLTGFTVNGVDSLPFLDNYFGSRVVTKNMKNTSFRYTLHHSERMIHFTTIISSGEHIPIIETYSQNKKQIKFLFGGFEPLDTTVFHRNLFLNSDPWDIIKLEPGGIRKIQKTVNGNTYLLQFSRI